MFIKFKVFNSGTDLPLEDQIQEVIVNTDNINFIASNPGAGVVIVFNSPTFEITNMLVVDSSLNEMQRILGM